MRDLASLDRVEAGGTLINSQSSSANLASGQVFHWGIA
jgi:hypothetical protein